MKVVDCFMFGLDYELDLLEIRLNYLSDVVDYFVLVEAAFTQLGTPKELFFEKNKTRFQSHLHKIVHVTLSTPVTYEYCSWANENFQRNQIMKGLEVLNLEDDDVVHISDLDEIPSTEGIRYFIDNSIPSPAGMDQDMYYYFLNTKADYKWSGCQLTRFKLLKSGVTPQQLRNERMGGYRIPVHGGWHFSYVGGAKSVLAKINSVCESNCHEQYKDENTLQRYIDNNTLHFSNAPLHVVDVTKVPYPQTIIDNMTKYKGLFK